MRQAQLIILLLLLLPWWATTAPVRANTLDPSHPIWKDPRIDHARLAAALSELRERQRKQPGQWAPARLRADKTAAVRNFLVIPVLYADGPDRGPLGQEELQARFFDSSRPHSFTRYWETASGGRLIPRGRVLPWVRLPRPRSQYENVFDGQPRLGATRLLAQDAVCAAAPALGPWWDFDDDGPDGVPGSGDDDGLIDFLIILHPYEGIEIEVESHGIMALQDRLDSQTVWDSCRVGADPFVVASALDPIGVWVHEAGHLLGLVDLYDLQWDSGMDAEGRASGGLGLWSLMAAGTWGGDGKRPTGLDAWSRSLLGWGHETVVSTEAVVELECSPHAEDWVCLRPAMDWGRERFLVELRSPTRGSPLDSALPAEGVLIYRVDEDARTCTGVDTLVAALMQADGRFDLENHRNQGDEGDPYTGRSGADELGPGTVPSSFSHHPGMDTLPPRIRVHDLGSGRYRVELEATARPRLLLSQALLDDGGIHLEVGETRSWDLRFQKVGDTVGTARLRVESLCDELEITPSSSEWIDLQREQDGSYRCSVVPTVHLAAGFEGFDAPVVLHFDLDGALSSMELALPVGTRAGLSAEAFPRWTPRVIEAGQYDTAFWPIVLPTGEPGWTVGTSWCMAYGECSELELLSPWIAPDPEGELSIHLLVRSHSEAANPGQAFDGGVLEWQVPGRGWLPLVPQGDGKVRIMPLSRARTAGAWGWGGFEQDWHRDSLKLPPTRVPCRLRLHFGADESVGVLDRQGAWGISQLSVGGSAWSAELEISPRGEGQWSAQLSVQDAPADMRASLWGRSRPAENWFLMAWAAPLDETGRVRFHFPMPDRPYLQLGAFVDEEPGVLLATAAYRASSPLLKVHPNPTHGELRLESGAVEHERRVAIYDLRGRVVRSLVWPAHLGLITWDGRDEKGRQVASGRYVARVEDADHPTAVFTLVR